MNIYQFPSNIKAFKPYKSNIILKISYLTVLIKPKRRLKIVKLQDFLIALVEAPEEFRAEGIEEGMAFRQDCLKLISGFFNIY
jgi:hypothetical protein